MKSVATAPTVDGMETLMEPELPICVECGDDLVCEGYSMCSECLEKYGDEALS
jgi:hypothetical protein